MNVGIDVECAVLHSNSTAAAIYRARLAADMAKAFGITADRIQVALPACSLLLSAKFTGAVTFTIAPSAGDQPTAASVASVMAGQTSNPAAAALLATSSSLATVQVGSAVITSAPVTAAPTAAPAPAAAAAAAAKVSDGGIAGIVIGVIVFIALLVLVYCFCYRKKESVKVSVVSGNTSEMVANPAHNDMPAVRGSALPAINSPNNTVMIVQAPANVPTVVVVQQGAQAAI